MRETDFIARNKDKWSKYETTLKRDQQDPDLLSELYVHTTEDLSYSRTFYPNRSVRVYLNGLARRTFLQLYRNRRGEGRRFLTFWTDELPRVLYARRRALLISLIIFTIAIAIGVVSFLIDGAFAELILGQQYVDQTREFIRSGDPMQVYKQRSPFEMFLTITFNNIFVALQAFIMGAFFSVGTVVILINNGVMLGVFQYFFVDQGLFRESFLTIWIHGALEISSIVIAGGAGLVMGSGLLFPGTYSRLQAFSRSARDGLKIMIGT
ncbi:MAG: stage II sporulation protein M, partial [Bacteroidota bacterium]